MAYPVTYDTFTAVRKFEDSISESVTIPVSAVPVSVNVTYPILDTVSMPGFTEVANGIVPVTGQYRVFYKTNTIEFGPNATQVTISGSYRTWGTRIGDLPIQGMINAITAIQSTLGLNPQGAYGTVAERFAHLEVGAAHTHNRIDLTSQITGSNNVFTLPTIPTFPQALLVLYNGVPAEQDVDYILDGANIVFLNTTPVADPDIPQIGDTLIVYYIYL